jgi:hypothetical protein
MEQWNKRIDKQKSVSSLKNHRALAALIKKI